MKKFVFTFTEVFTSHPGRQLRFGFTLAEVLITLGIIGVVAAVTMPTLISHHRKSVVETRLAKFYSAINQAITMSETVNGDKMDWPTSFNGWEVDEDGNPDHTKPSKALSWYNTYLKDFIANPLKVEVDENSVEGKVDVYFSDGSVMLWSSTSVIFYPFAKDYKKEEKEGYIERKTSDSGTKWFTFMFAPYSTCERYHGKGVEPYKSCASWNGERANLFTGELGCSKETQTKERAFCTVLIQMNGWKIPKDYPLKF